MRNASVTEISKELSVSKSTVSKVLRHCPGVNSDLRAKILQHANEKKIADDSNCDFYFIIPDKPGYLWSELQNTLIAEKNQRNRRMTVHVYSQLGDETAVLHYLEDARQKNAGIVILTALMTDRIRSKIKELLRNALVILLSEYDVVINCPYVGNDPFLDGKKMGHLYQEKYQDRHLIILIDDYHRNSAERIRGLMTQLRSADDISSSQITTIHLNESVFQSRKLLPAKLAAELAAHTKGAGSYCIYFPFAVQNIKLILHKASLLDRCVCLCHDSDDLDIPGVHCMQNIEHQINEAILMADTFLKTLRYPPSKFVYTPPVFHNVT